MGDEKKVLIAFPDDDALFVARRPCRGKAVEYEMRGAAAMLRYRGCRVTIPDLAAYLELSESTIRKRFERDPRLRLLIGLVPGQKFDKRRKHRMKLGI